MPIVKDKNHLLVGDRHMQNSNELCGLKLAMNELATKQINSFFSIVLKLQTTKKA
jgi:hypothetical protein